MPSLVALVGTKFRGEEMLRLLANLPNGEPLILKREPTNQYDPNAVQVWARGHHIGYVKGNQNKPIARTLDKLARVDSVEQSQRIAVTAIEMPAKLAIDGGRQPMIEIEE